MKRRPMANTTLSLYAIAQVSAIVLFIFLFITYSPVIQRLSQFPPITPQELKATMGQHNRQQAIWADYIQTNDGSFRVVIKHSSYEGTVWSEPVVLSNLVIPLFTLIPPGYWGPLNWRVVTSLACSDNGSMSAGWITYNSTFSNDVGSVQYVVHDGTEWSQSNSLTNQSNIANFQLRYSRDGVLFAAWLELNYSTYSEARWKLYCWEVGSPSLPQLVFEGNESYYYDMDSVSFILLPGRNGSIHLFCKTPTSILFRANVNGTWSAIDSFSGNYYGVWGAAIDSQERIHLVYDYYNGFDDTALRYTSFFNGTWGSNETLVQGVSVVRLWLAVSSLNELQVLWAQIGQHAFSYNPVFFTVKYFDGNWTSKIQVMGLPSGSIESQLVLGAGDTYLIQEQPLGSARQFAHYQLGFPHFSETLGLNVTEVHFLGIVSTSIPQMLTQFQVYALGFGTIMVIGVAVFFPLVYRFLRSSFRQILQP
ncbi:MAG: hypothetical protein ACFE89_11345 [Candidatus Hodarchaeota archaeon]